MNTNINCAIINLIQAMLGSITSNWRAVFIRSNDGTFVVTFVLLIDSAEDRDEIGDVTFEFEALEPESDVSVAITVSEAPLETFAELGRLVFARKE